MNGKEGVMRLAMIGLGKMGANMTRRLRQGGIEVVGFNRSKQITKTLEEEVGMIAAPSATAAINKLTSSPRIVWLMLPSGDPTRKEINNLAQRLSSGDIVVDGGNSYYRDSLRNSATLGQQGIGFIDVGTSGGVWGLQNGYCLMVGGEKSNVQAVEPILKVLAPAPDRGWAHVGPVGSGHFTKMIHNGIEYGMMQAFAEGFALLRSKKEFDLDLAQVSELWRHGSVVQSWLLDLIAGSLEKDQQLEGIAPVVADSGEGRWTMMEAINQGVAAPVISMALQMRFASQDEENYENRLLSVMRNAFGGHEMKKTGKKG